MNPLTYVGGILSISNKPILKLENEMNQLYVRVNPRSGLAQFHRCAMLFTLIWVSINVDDATAERLKNEQILETSETMPEGFLTAEQIAANEKAESDKALAAAESDKAAAAKEKADREAVTKAKADKAKADKAAADKAKADKLKADKAAADKVKADKAAADKAAADKLKADKADESKKDSDQ